MTARVRLTIYTKAGREFLSIEELPLSQGEVISINAFAEGMEQLIKRGGVLSLSSNGLYVGVSATEIEAFSVEAADEQ